MLFYSNHFRLILRGWQRQQVRCLRVLVMHATTIASALCQNQVQIKICNEFLCQGRCRNAVQYIWLLACSPCTNL